MSVNAFQWIFDNAENISITRRGTVAQTISRSSVVRSVSRGGKIWRFDVKLPDGLMWADYRAYIESMEQADRHTTVNVQMNNTGYNYINQYQGDANTSNIVVQYANASQPTTLTMSSVSSLSASDYIFKAGDWIQLGSLGKVYSVVNDVQRGSDVIGNVTFNVHRPILETAGGGNITLKVGQAVDWNVVCVEMPSWRIVDHGRIEWAGNFVFYEV